MHVDVIDPKKTAMIVVDMQNDFVASAEDRWELADHLAVDRQMWGGSQSRYHRRGLLPLPTIQCASQMQV